MSRRARRGEVDFTLPPGISARSPTGLDPVENRRAMGRAIGLAIAGRLGPAPRPRHVWSALLWLLAGGALVAFALLGLASTATRLTTVRVVGTAALLIVLYAGLVLTASGVALLWRRRHRRPDHRPPHHGPFYDH